MSWVVHFLQIERSLVSSFANKQHTRKRKRQSTDFDNREIRNVLFISELPWSSGPTVEFFRFLSWVCLSVCSSSPHSQDNIQAAYYLKMFEEHSLSKPSIPEHNVHRDLGTEHRTLSLGLLLKPFILSIISWPSNCSNCGWVQFYDKHFCVYFVCLSRLWLCMCTLLFCLSLSQLTFYLCYAIYVAAKWLILLWLLLFQITPCFS